jgi:iron complex outermembrane receptor protein
MKSIPTAALAAASAIAFAQPAQAEEIPTYLGDPVVVTATRFSQPLRDTAVNMAVITRTDIDNSAAKTLPELLLREAGVASRDLYGNNAASATVDMRGFGASAGQNTLILLDGRRIADIDLSGVQWSAIPLAAIERIEILRSSGAVLYGDGATGGVINIVTRAPVSLGKVAEVSARAGSYRAREAQAFVNLAGEQLALSLVANTHDSDGYRRNNENRQDNLLADLRWKLGGGELGIKMAADRQDIRLPAGRRVQPSAGVNQLEEDRRGARTPLDYASRDGNQVSGEYVRRTGLGEMNIGLAYRDKNQKSYFDQGGFPVYNDADLSVWAFTPRLKSELKDFVIPGSLVLGLDWQRWNYGRDISDRPENIGRPYHRVHVDQEQRALYGRFTGQATRDTTLIAGYRLERVTTAARDTLDAGAPGALFETEAAPVNGAETQHAAELALRHALSPGLAASLRYQRSYRFGTVDEIFETDAAFNRAFQLLRPQTAKGWEAGLEGGGTRSAWRATLFRLDVRDEIHLDPFTAGVGNTNLPPLRREGLELEGRMKLEGGWSLNGSYTHTRARFTGGSLPDAAVWIGANPDLAGNEVPLVPRHQVNVSAAWDITGRDRLSLSANYVSERHMDNDETNNLGVKIPARTVADLKYTRRQGNLTASLAINNLFDRQYFDYAVRSQFIADRYEAYPLPERNAWIAVEYRFK